MRRATIAPSSFGFFFFLSLLLSFLGLVGIVVRSAAALAEAELDVWPHNSLRPRSPTVDPTLDDDAEEEEVVPGLPACGRWRVLSLAWFSSCSLSITYTNWELKRIEIKLGSVTMDPLLARCVELSSSVWLCLTPPEAEEDGWGGVTARNPNNQKIILETRSPVDVTQRGATAPLK